jgi:hypothetical protein
MGSSNIRASDKIKIARQASPSRTGMAIKLPEATSAIRTVTSSRASRLLVLLSSIYSDF